MFNPAWTPELARALACAMAGGVIFGAALMALWRDHVDDREERGGFFIER